MKAGTLPGPPLSAPGDEELRDLVGWKEDGERCLRTTFASIWGFWQAIVVERWRPTGLVQHCRGDKVDLYCSSEFRINALPIQSSFTSMLLVII